MVASEAKWLSCHHKWGQNYSLCSCSGIDKKCSLSTCECWVLPNSLLMSPGLTKNQIKCSKLGLWYLLPLMEENTYCLFCLAVWHKSWAAVLLPCASRHEGWWGAGPALSSVGWLIRAIRGAVSMQIRHCSEKWALSSSLGVFCPWPFLSAQGFFPSTEGTRFFFYSVSASLPSFGNEEMQNNAGSPALWHSLISHIVQKLCHLSQ